MPANLHDSYKAAAESPQVTLADLAFMTNERGASASAPVLMDFVARWMEQRHMAMGLACFDLLRDKKCPPQSNGKTLTRQDNETPSIIHELSQALYTIALAEAGYEMPDVEMLLCMNFTHDLGEDFDISKTGFKQNLYKHGLPRTDRTDLAAELFENMTKSRGDMLKYPDNTWYFNTMLEHPVTVIAKFQDRIHNMATLIGVKKREKHREYIEETMDLTGTLNKAQDLYPEYAPVFDIMSRIVSTLTYFNAQFLNVSDPENPVKMQPSLMPRLQRITQLPEGLDPLKITQSRAENKLRWMAAYQKPASPV